MSSTCIVEGFLTDKSQHSLGSCEDSSPLIKGVISLTSGYLYSRLLQYHKYMSHISRPPVLLPYSTPTPHRLSSLPQLFILLLSLLGSLPHVLCFCFSYYDFSILYPLFFSPLSQIALIMSSLLTMFNKLLSLYDLDSSRCIWMFPLLNLQSKPPCRYAMEHSCPLFM